MSDLKNIINDAFENKGVVSLTTTGRIRDAVNSTLDQLDKGSLRVSEKVDGEWIVNQWLKKAILLKIKHILLDNMNIKKIKEACKIIGKSAKIEVSGGINLQNVKKISNIGVNFISVGSITQSAPAAKISLKLKKI